MRATYLSLPLLLVAVACGDDDDQGRLDACTGACAELTFAVDFADAAGEFDRAYFGLTAPSMTDSGTWELHVEIYAGGDDGCPTESSATPDQTVIVAGLSVDPPAEGELDAIVTLLDFAYEFVEPGGSPVVRGAPTSATWVAADPCPACSVGDETDRPDRFVSLDVAATFEDLGGSGGGRVYATHCDSLDVLDPD